MLQDDRVKTKNGPFAYWLIYLFFNIHFKTDIGPHIEDNKIKAKQNAYLFTAWEHKAGQRHSV